jgi:two-component system, chemotaxis family, response regulator Rcp1
MSEPRSIRVLLAEDNPADVDLLRRALAHRLAALELCVVEDGEEVIELLARLLAGGGMLPDLVVVDLNLVTADGRAVLRQMRSAPAWRSVPVVVWSSSDSPRDREDSLALGARAFFTKPTSVAELTQLGECLQRLVSGTRLS